MKRSLILFWLLLCAGYASAQTTTAQINGTVTDSSGAVVPNATITAKNPDTGFTRTAQSTDTGSYALTFLPPGAYEVRTEARGFSIALQKNVVLNIGQSATLNFTLKPGGANEVITVSEEPPLVESTRSEVGSSVSPTEVKSLPILDRNFSSLMSLVPGVRPAEGFDPTKTRSGNVSINGSDGRAVDYNVDGGDNKDNVIGGIVQNFTMEGIQEFNVIVNRYTAESGRSAAGVVNVVSKSGTNSLHGSLFSLFQNSTLNKIDFFAKQAGNPKPVFHRYHFGGSVGGKVIRDKLFFFGAYEQKREPGSISVNPDAFEQLSFFPLAQPVAQLPFPYIDHLLTVKADHHISSKQNMFYRYGRERWTNPNDQLGNPFNADLSQTNSDINQFHDFVIQHNYTISSNKVNSINLHFQDFANSILPAPSRAFTLPVAGGGIATNPEICFNPTPGCGGGSPEIGQNVNVPQQTLIRKYQLRDDLTWLAGRHNMKFGANYIYLAKLGGFFFFGANGYQVVFWDDPSVIATDTTAYPQNFATPGAVQEIAFSGGSGSTAQDPAHSIALYLQDDFKVTNRLTLNLGLRWDANPNFLVPQLGDQITNTNRAIGVLRELIAANPTAPEAQQGLQMAQALAGDADALRRNTADWKEFQPRIGFAWDPTGSGKAVIRGGYGIARDQIFQNLTLFSVQQTQPTIYQTLIDLLSDSGPRDPGGCSGQLCSFRFGVDPLPAPAPGVTGLAPGAVGRINAPRVTDPWSQQASLGFSWQFHPDFAVSADYIHVLGTHEPRVLQANPRISPVCSAAFPGANPADPRCVSGSTTRLLDAAFEAAGLGAGRLSELRVYSTSNRSLYDGINFQLRKRLSQRFSFQTSYVTSWSRSWGGRPTSSYSGSGINITPERQFAADEWGSTIFDERHRFVVSGSVELPAGFEISPIFQAASARPYSFRSGTDVDGDGRSTLDRVCVGSTLAAPIITPGCQQVDVNTLRGKPFVQLDLRTSKNFKFGERASLRFMWEFYNLFNRDNFCNNFLENASSSNFNNPQGYCGGQGFGPGFSGPLRSQYGLRFEF